MAQVIRSPITHTEDVNEVLGSRLWLKTMWGVNRKIGATRLSLLLFASQISNRIKMEPCA